MKEGMNEGRKEGRTKHWRGRKQFGTNYNNSDGDGRRTRDRGGRGEEADNNQTLTTIINWLLGLTLNIPSLLTKVSGLQTVGRVR